MWQLYMIMFVGWGTSSYGGPIIVDGFKTEAACIAHGQKIINATPKEFPVLISGQKPEFKLTTCLKVEK